MTSRVVDLGDACITLELEPTIEPATSEACLAIAARIPKSNLTGIREIVTTYHTVALHIDPLVCDRAAVASELSRLATAPSPPATPGTQFEIPVCYGDELGPDLADVARFAHCTEEAVVQVHTASNYRVYMIGFLPGFAYLGQIDKRIAMGRLETPRKRVAAGSVAIAGSQTGIYPIDSPGGWRIIGRTWVKPFDLRREDPAMFHAGDMVRFVAVTRSAYLHAVSTQSDDGLS